LTWNVSATSGRVAGPALANVGVTVGAGGPAGGVVDVAAAVAGGSAWGDVDEVHAASAVAAAPARKLRRGTDRALVPLSSDDVSGLNVVEVVTSRSAPPVLSVPA
jgi:hypothetical protein